MNENLKKIWDALEDFGGGLKKGEMTVMVAKPKTPIEHAFDCFLRGLACRWDAKEILWVDDEERFFILKHKAHASYGDRMSGSSNCPSRYFLCDVENLPADDKLAYALLREESFVKVFTGRWNKAKMSEVQQIIKDIKETENGF